VSVRCQQAVVWVDEARLRQTRILHADLYSEGEVQLDNGPARQRGPRALLDLNTRGELKIRAQGSKVVQQPHYDDPLLLRAQVQRLGRNRPGPRPPPPALQRIPYREVPRVPPARAAPRANVQPPVEPPPMNPPMGPSRLPPMPTNPGPTGTPMQPYAP